MSLMGQGIRIIVSEPSGWKHGNIFGRVIKERGKAVLLKLSEPITGKKFSSDLLELRPRYEGDALKPLEQFYALIMTGALVHPETNDTEHILTGSVAMD